MDKRGWPWKKKSSEKQAATALDSLAAASELDTAVAEKVKQEANKKPKYVQISMESYTHLTGLENQVKLYEEQVQSLEDEVKEVKEKLSEANTEMTNKENLVKQHAKVAEEAVSGWEKAEAEAAALKNHLESVTLLKLTAEDRASHLDGALKECMRQIRNLKEEHEHNLHEVILSKQKLFDKMKLDLESRISSLEQDIMRSAAENTALSRSLQERSNLLIQLSEEKSQAKAEIEILKSNIESWEKEVSSLKYELHIARKEVEIRNEEKNMSVRSAEVANRQYLEGAKKIAKLEAECQRLRGLVRKKLPGPAALAQMKLEVESLGRDYGEPRLRRSPVKPPSPHSPQFSEFSLDGSQKYLKENEMLTERLLAMEEEMKMLKEALANRNSELQASRSAYAQTACRLQSLEAKIQASVEQKNHVKDGKRLSFASMSEDGNDDSVSCSGSWTTTALTSSEASHLKKEKNGDSPLMSENTSNHLDLMDDFLEMEKLAYLSNGSNGAVSKKELSDKTTKSGPELSNNETLVEVTGNKDSKESHLRQPDQHVFVELQSRISMLLKLMSGEKGMEKVVEDVRRMLQDMYETLSLQTACSGKINDTEELFLSRDGNSSSKDVETINQELQTAITQIYDFIMIIGSEAKTPASGIAPDEEGLNEKLDIFSAKYSEGINSNINPIDFVLDISHVLNKASELHFKFLGFNGSEVECGSSDCIDKIALPENKPDLNSAEERYSANGCARFSDSTSDPDVPNYGNLVPTSESTAAPWKCSLEEFEQLKADKNNLADELARCMENFETKKSQLLETEQILCELRSQLALAEKSNSLAETQLKCMAESYKSLETRTEELKNEVGVLREKIESLENELEEERRRHQEAVKRGKDLEAQLERMDSSEAAENDDKTSQEKELATAAEKLAECQETIFLLGKQLKALRPQTHNSAPPHNSSSEDIEPSIQEEPTISGMANFQEMKPSETDTFCLDRDGSESPIDPLNSTYALLDSEPSNPMRSPVGSKYPKQYPTKSGSSSALSTTTPEKHARGFSRFFSPKGKN